jgi:outer membrane protein OmpA-like peptidoglycan-associated protein
MRIYARGHADSVGRKTNNGKLSLKRAMTVCEAIEDLVGPRPKCEPLPFGELEPLAPNCTATGGDSRRGRRQNRRVTVVLSPAEGHRLHETPDTWRRACRVSRG